jgi:uncharacterized protein (TIGR02246 family)
MDLEVIEELKQLKARYFRYLDTKDWAAWATVFTEDAVLEHPANRVEAVAGRDAIVELVSASLGDAVTIHHGHMPEIEVLGPDTARGVWAMYDRLIFPVTDGVEHYEGYGHYLEQYVRGDDGRWRIRHVHLRRLHIEVRRRARDADPSIFWA